MTALPRNLLSIVQSMSRTRVRRKSWRRVTAYYTASHVLRRPPVSSPRLGTSPSALRGKSIPCVSAAVTPPSAMDLATNATGAPQPSIMGLPPQYSPL
ncbi:unnamed protein product [Staurois parvus]|uniref:Uncharacterized protein n=1 Tax=Staurois parvus TaxID=386267 RepID=A0ABN9AEU8_9NEOB|nr:unnamed protein product [Staurois parvus]